MNDKNQLLEKCFFHVRLAMDKQKITKTYFGAISHRYWFFKVNRSRDEDNFCSGTKYYTDSLKHCGLIEDDSNRHIIGGDVFHFDGQETERLVYILEMIENKEQFDLLKQQKKEGLFINKIENKGNLF